LISDLRNRIKKFIDGLSVFGISFVLYNVSRYKPCRGDFLSDEMLIKKLLGGEQEALSMN
jgi:hypothetical protein